jgi:hypothetical protein
MARKVKITTLNDYTETITVRDDLTLEDVFLNSEDNFIVIPTLHGGEYVFQKAAIISIVREPRRGHS